MRILSIY
jgi:predicted RNA-binding protein with TRAM domain